MNPPSQSVRVGNIYQDIDGLRRGRARDRFVRVVRIMEDDRYVLIENTKTLRKTPIIATRLQKPFRFSLVTEAANVSANTYEPCPI